MSDTAPPPDDFDGPWKEALERYLKQALELLAPKIHRAINWDREVVFLNRELQRFLPEGGSGPGCVDVLAQVHLRNGNASRLLLHAEVQGQPRPNFGERIFRYWYRLFDATDLPVESIAILADTRESWRPDHFEASAIHAHLRFSFLSVKLLDFEDRLEELEQSDNPFALFVVAHLTAKRTKDGEERLYWKLRLVRRLIVLGYTAEDARLLFRLVDWVIRLPTELKIRFRDEVCAMEEENSVEFIDCISEMYLERGMEKAKRESILQVLEARFGPVPTSTGEALTDLHDLTTLENLTRVAATVPDLASFAQALDSED